MGIDIAAVMDAMRILAIERKADLADSRGKQFNRSFLGSVRHHGRVFEAGMMTAYKFRTGDFMSDVDKVPKMVAKGKLSFLPKRSLTPKKSGRSSGGLKRRRIGEVRLLSRMQSRIDRLGFRPFDAGGLPRAGDRVGGDPDWVCCGSTPAHASNAALAVALPV